jgi:hypothetical protein
MHEPSTPAADSFSQSRRDRMGADMDAPSGINHESHESHE